MSKKKFIMAATATAMAVSISFSGCSLVSTLSKEDMEQVIATVDITKSENYDTTFNIKEKNVITATSITKRDLVAAFLNLGYSYIQNGSSYAEAFTTLANALVDSEVLTQYSAAYIYSTTPAIQQEYLAILNNNDLSGVDKDIAKYETLLGGKDNEQVQYAQYLLYTSINASIDNYEKEYLEEEDEKTGGTETRSMPSDVDAETDKYYPTTTKNGKKVLNYGIYTGYNGHTLVESEVGAYVDDALDGSTKTTRKRAYNRLLSTLKSNYLLSESETNLTNPLEISYFKEEYRRQLESELLECYYDAYEESIMDKIKGEDGNYEFVKNSYEKLLSTQKDTNSNVASFEASLGNLSDTSFILYTAEKPEDCEVNRVGYVYNILLPFSTVQSNALSALNTALSNNAIDRNEYYAQRKMLLENIKTTDQRSAWFNGATDYSFKADRKDSKFAEVLSSYNVSDIYQSSINNGTHLFFENNLTNNERYEELSTYIGLYPYNGKVYENTDKSYTLLPNELSIDDMLLEFTGYLDYVLSGYTKKNNLSAINITMQKDAAYRTNDFKKYEDGEWDKNGNGEIDTDEIDYSKFVYATGKVELDANNRDLMNKSTAQYLAMSAVNELQYAYTTDTGVLSQYVGYKVEATATSYIKEFEYVAQQAIMNGTGSFAVCAGDYGWHLIYVTNTFDLDDASVYDQLDWKANIEVEGTFENLFYEMVKSKELSNQTTTRRSSIINMFTDSESVQRFESTYEDLMSMGN